MKDQGCSSDNLKQYGQFDLRKNQSDYSHSPRIQLKLSLPIRVFTIINQIKSSTAASIRGDVLAGITVAIMVIPQGMAYAMLAGLPPVYGLYAALVPLLIYPLFGSSRHLSIGPVAVISIIVLEGLSQLAAPGTSEFIQLALLTSLLAGLMQVLLSVLKLGFLVNFLSEPVIKGFAAAAALIIGVSQIPHLLGISVDRSRTFYGYAKGIVVNADETNLITLGVGIVGIAVIVAARKVSRKIPGGLIAVILTTVAVLTLGLTDHEVLVVGEVRSGLPPFQWIELDLETIGAVLPLAAVICIISFIESLAIAKTISAQHSNYHIDANKELFALGSAKMLGSFFGAFPNSASFTRSAVNSETGASSGIASIVAGLVVMLTLLFLTPLFAMMPKAILASIVVVAVVGLIDFADAKRIFKIDRRDFYVLLATFLLTLIFGVQAGVLSGVILSVVMILIKTSRPHYAVLGRLEGTKTYRNIKRYPDALLDDDFLIIRYDVDLYFGNAEHFYDTVIAQTKQFPGRDYIILNMAAIGSIDTTGLHKMGLLVDALAEGGVTLLLAGTRGQVRDTLAISGLQDKIGLQNCYLTIADAVEGHHSDDSGLSNRYASQTNV